MAFLKNASTSPSSSFEINLLSSDSSEAKSVDPSSSTKKRPSAAKKKVSKKARFALPDSLTDAESLRFWGLEHKIYFVSFSKRPIVPGRVVNLEQLEASHCAVSTFFRAQKLSLLLRLCGLEFYEEHVRLFYANLRVSTDSGEWETLVLGNRIVLNDSLFKNVFGSDFSGDIPLLAWQSNRILAHIVAITLIPQKGSLSNISNRVVYVVYCLLKKHRINWALLFHEYMVESLEDTNSFFSLPYGLLISRIIVDSLVDLSPFRPSLIDATYDTRTFSIIGYVLINNKWYKKESVQQRADAPKFTRISVDSTALLLKETDLIKVLQDTLGKVLQLHKDSSTDVGKLRLEAIRSVNTILKEVNSIKTGADSVHNELDVTVHTSYSNFSKNVERTYDSFCRNVINTLKYLHGRGRNQGKQNLRMSTKEGNKINQQRDSSRRSGDLYSLHQRRINGYYINQISFIRSQKGNGNQDDKANQFETIRLQITRSQKGKKEIDSNSRWQGTSTKDQLSDH
ncbi:hypothetical protein H5410_004845 [Solanum commersonii]|uniref:Uncharacterized protein n=1 Tax=Solanum commersonii TaxID=4109 RepID=A0A9J6A5Q5_SOLCO|nr:hypothetical protein H5410_004845 [Solanum commersonii]